MGFSEIVFLLVIALILFGPEDLPDIARAIGRIVFEIKKAASDITREFQDAIDDPVNTVSKSLDTIINTNNQTKNSDDQAKEELSQIDSNEWKAVNEDNPQIKEEDKEILLRYEDAGDKSQQVPKEADKYDPLAELPSEIVSYEKKDASR